MKHTQPMQIEDVDQVVAIHLAAFQNFFLSFLGPKFLNTLYSAALEDLSGIAFVWISEGKVIGFVSGTDNPGGLYTRLLRKRTIHFSIAAFPSMIRKPVILPRLFRAFSMPQQGTKPPGCGKLMSIAVLPETQNRGVGKALVNAFLEESRKKGLRQVFLDTDMHNNDHVNRFYQDLGFVASRVFVTPEGRWMNEYVIELMRE